MAEPIERKVRVLEAQYVEEAQSIVLVGECQEGKIRNQIHRDCFSYGSRSEEEIKKELEKLADMMIGKVINMVFDPDLNGKIESGQALRYRHG